MLTKNTVASSAGATAGRTESYTPVPKAVFSLTILTQPEGHSQIQLPPAEKIASEKRGFLEAHLKALTGLQLTIWRRGQLGAKYKWGKKT